MKRSSTETDHDPLTRPSPTSNAWLIAGILLIAVNLRPALASVGPLVDEIRRTTGLSSLMLGMLTTLPLMAFGVISTLTPLFTRRFGVGGTLLGAMALLALGVAMRWIPSIFALYLGTALAGIAIALGNVLLPSIAKRHFESRSGLMTSLYSSAMGLGAAMAAGISVPLADDLGLGWRGSLSVWALPAVLAMLVWLPQLRRLKRTQSRRSFKQALKDLGTSKLAWMVAFFMGLQSLTYYIVLAWLPAILLSRGYDSEVAGWMLSLSQATGILGSLTIPFIAGRTMDQRGIVLGLVIAETIGIAGLMMPQSPFVVLWVTLIGFVLGGTFGLALLLIVVRTRHAETATELSGMAQSIGYFIAATGPLYFGSLFDLTGTWTLPLASLLVVAAFKLVMGLGAGKPGTLD